jgi:hypothetical protein
MLQLRKSDIILEALRSFWTAETRSVSATQWGYRILVVHILNVVKTSRYPITDPKAKRGRVKV